MPVAVATAESGTPLSLYLDLEEGQFADLEVVGRAALAWSAAIKEIAYHLDPSLELRVGLASGTPGSLSLDSIIRCIKKAKDEPVTLGALAIIGALYFGAEFAHDGIHRIIERILGEETLRVELSPEQIGQIGVAVAKSVNGNVAQPQIKQVYRELERDPAVKGVGVSAVPGKKPAVIVPRSEFQARSGRSVETSAQTVEHRTLHTAMQVVLIRPVLLAGERRWGLLGPAGEFGATIKDKDFIERTLSGTTAIPMVAGIQMDIELEVKEEFRGGVWTVLDRSVTHVFGLRRPPVTGDLFSPKPQNDEPPDGGEDD